MGTHWQILVGGELRDARSGETIETINPASGEVIGTFPRCDAQDVDDAVNGAATAFERWRQTNPAERAPRSRTSTSASGRIARCCGRTPRSN